MDSNFTVESLAAGMILAREVNYQPKVPPLGPKQKVPPEPVTIKAETISGADSEILPKCPMVYAVITDSATIGDPNTPDWQPQLHTIRNRISKPALVPLNMANVSLNVECQIGISFVTVQGSWVLHCIKGGLHCDCLLVVPMNPQGTIISLDIEMGRRHYRTVLIEDKGVPNYGKKKFMGANRSEIGMYNPEMFIFKIPQVMAGESLSLKILWFQPMMFLDRNYSVFVPFNFPEYLVPPNKDASTIIQISCTIDIGVHQDLIITQLNHPLKELSRIHGRVMFSSVGADHLYNSDFLASYMVSLCPVLLVQEPSHKLDKRGTFYISICPPDLEPVHMAPRKAFVFLLDRSSSMRNDTMDDACHALISAISRLQPTDCFNIITFDHEVFPFSSTLQNADDHSISLARDWIKEHCKARGGTAILEPLMQAMQMLQNIEGAVSHIFLITDGSVVDERNICQLIQEALKVGPCGPRISTFGIGQFCNHYFLKMLAVIGHGLSDVAFQSGKVKEKMDNWFLAASLPLITNISIVIPDSSQGCEVYPSPIPDLFYGTPLVVSGNFSRDFPHAIKIIGVLTNGNAWEVEVEASKSEHIDLGKVCAKQQLDFLVGQAWLHADESAKQQAINLSMKTGISCGLTKLLAFEAAKEKKVAHLQENHQETAIDMRKHAHMAVTVMGGLGTGFGNVKATIDNVPSMHPSNGRTDTMSKMLYCYDWGLCGDCCSSCVNADRYSCPACVLNCLVYSCQMLCVEIACTTCCEICLDCMCYC